LVLLTQLMPGTGLGIVALIGVGMVVIDPTTDHIALTTTARITTLIIIRLYIGTIGITN